MSLTDLAMASPPAGWPRPLSVQRYEQPGRSGTRRVPVPWNADSMGQLGAVHYDRQGITYDGDTCQTCGLGFDESEAYLIVGLDMPDRVEALDHGLLHRRCLVLSLNCCPHLMARRDWSIRRAPVGQGVTFKPDQLVDVTDEFIP